jgi:AraC-like DNA-binding protein
VSTDTLSEVLRAVRLSGAVFFRVEAFPPFVAEAPAAKAVAPHVMPGAEHVIEYHVVTRGSCFASLIDGPAVELHAGDIVVFPQGDAHVVSSRPGMRGEPDFEAHRHPDRGQLPIAMTMGTPAPGAAEVVCGFLGCDAQPFNPLLATLPRMIHVAHGRNGLNHIPELIRVALGESAARGAGSECMLSRLSELLFIEVVRKYIVDLPRDTTGWLAGLRDEVVGRALGALHDRPAHPWGLDDLASEVGLSRSMLAERFHHFVGVPPMQYLARWRMQLAAGLLSNGSAPMIEIATRVGYGSEAAFSRAFKRWVGIAPSAWRAGERGLALDPRVAAADETDGEEAAVG